MSQLECVGLAPVGHQALAKTIQNGCVWLRDDELGGETGIAELWQAGGDREDQRSQVICVSVYDGQLGMVPGVEVDPRRGLRLLVDDDIVDRRVSVANRLPNPVAPVGLMTMQLMKRDQRRADRGKLFVARAGGIGEDAS